jgi:hypothetical protein
LINNITIHTEETKQEIVKCEEKLEQASSLRESDGGNREGMLKELQELRKEN